MIGSAYSIVQLLCFSTLGLVLFLASMIIGLWLYNVQLKNTIRTYFVNLFLGLFTIVTLVSMVMTGLKTIQLIAFPVLVFLIIQNPERFRIARVSIPALVHILYIFPAVFLLYGCFSVGESIENDLRYYSKIAFTLGTLGQENHYHFYNSYLPGFNGMMPYHYFELWIVSFIGGSFGIKSIICLKYVCYPFLIACTCYGVLGFVSRQKPWMFLLFLALSLFPLYKVGFIPTGHIIYTDFWLRPNYIMYYFCLLPLFFLIQEKQWLKLYLFTILVAVTSFIIIPSLLGGIFVLSLFLFKRNELSKRTFIFYNLLLLAAMLGMGVLYSVYSPALNLMKNQSIIDVIINSLAFWKAILYTTIVLIAESGLLVALALVIDRYFLKQLQSFLMIYVFAQLVFGVLIFQGLNQLDNCYQFPYFGFAASGFVLIISLLLLADKIKGPLVYLVPVFAAGVAMFFTAPLFNFATFSESLEQRNLSASGVSRAWAARAERFITAGKKGGHVRSAAEMKDVMPKSRNCLTNQVGSFLAYITDDCNLPSLTCSDILFMGRTGQNRSEFLKAEKWYGLFPNYTGQCNPLEYLKRKQFDYFITTDTTFKSTNQSVIESADCKYILVGNR